VTKRDDPESQTTSQEKPFHRRIIEKRNKETKYSFSFFTFFLNSLTLVLEVVFTEEEAKTPMKLLVELNKCFSVPMEHKLFVQLIYYT